MPRFTPESSPRTRTKPKRSSTVRFNCAEISDTDSAAALSPGVSSLTARRTDRRHEAKKGKP
jgi:hypothetical protein